MKNSGIKYYNPIVVAENAERLSHGLQIKLGKEAEKFYSLQEYFSKFPEKKRIIIK